VTSDELETIQLLHLLERLAVGKKMSRFLTLETEVGWSLGWVPVL